MEIIIFIVGVITFAVIVYCIIRWQKAETQAANINEQMAILTEQLNTAQAHNVELQDKLHHHELDMARLEEEKKQTAEKITALTQYKTEMKEQMREQFENIANKILTDKDSNLVENNRKRMDSIIEPFKTQLQTFSQGIQQTNRDNTEERASLKTHIATLQTNIHNISTEAANLSKALKGDKKQQGNWGELMLEKVLEDSGLEKNVNYELQPTFKNEAGDRRRPDCVIYLPENRQLIVDAKVSLNAYNDFINASDDIVREQSIKLHLQAINKHISDLADKDYSNLAAIKSPDFVFIFLPLESAFHAAIQYDQKLLDNAAKKGIVLASPTTLLAMLKMVSYLWKVEKQQKNVEEIAKRGGRLYDKFCGFVEDMESIDKSIVGLQGTYEKAMKKLSTGQGNLLAQSQEMQKLGIKNRKELPAHLISDADETSI